MTRKDYIQIAKAIKDSQGVKAEINPPSFTWDIDYHKFMLQICEYFERDNSLFDENRFRKACGELIEE